MHSATILVKTAKAQEEIEQRTYKLPHKLRVLLIMVDGKQDVARLIDRGLVFGDVAQMLRELLSLGFVEEAGSEKARPAAAAAPAPVTAPPAPAAAAPTPAAASLPEAIAAASDQAVESAKRLINGYLFEVFGPMASGLVSRIEKSANRTELAECVQASLKSLEKKIRADKFNEFHRRILAQLSS